MIKTIQSFKLSQFIKEESLGGVLLILTTIIALVWVNNAPESYHHFWHDNYSGLNLGPFKLNINFHHLINDGLMAFFFFTIGLEIKREIIGGELSSLRKAILPIGAALGGMLVPALLYFAVNSSHPEYLDGWGIPMATDIAFALGVLSLLGNRVPLSLKVFLTALAIADDLGAILVIAIFYTENIHFSELLYAAGGLIVLFAANLLKVRRTTFYAFIGLTIVWLAFLFSGVHATIAGVLVALAIPARPKISVEQYLSDMSAALTDFNQTKPNDISLLTRQQAHLIDHMEQLTNDAHTPLQKLEHALHPLAAYFILPVFALANAGVHISGNIFTMLIHPVSLGIIAGLVLGKTLGISILTEILVRSKLAELPRGIRRKHILGAAMLAGIGFTMSIFVADLAFPSPTIAATAKVGIFAASILSGILGALILLSGRK